MGIEPTCEAFAASHNGFEDRGRHQASSHFRKFTMESFDSIR